MTKTKMKVRKSKLQLGRKVEAPTNPMDAVIDPLMNFADRKYVVRFTCPEFTARCPVTHAPDFATVIIDYVPDKYLAESKSLKLYLQSYREQGAFHEDCIMTIVQRLEAVLKPIWLRIAAFYAPRGGIPIDVFYQSGEPPTGIYVPSLEGHAYHAR